MKSKIIENINSFSPYSKSNIPREHIVCFGSRSLFCFIKTYNEVEKRKCYKTLNYKMIVCKIIAPKILCKVKLNHLLNYGRDSSGA